ncbi:MAG: chemotaxis protein CheA [Nitrospirota bacterium]|nr:MAG: chemotaxis protein CheA [Nitrospirota bacterium]
MNGEFDHLNEDEFNELKRTFFSQSHEILEEIQDSALRLEMKPEDDGEIKLLQRSFHTLKGDSNSMALSGISTICHRVEDVLTDLQNKTRKADPRTISMILKSVDIIDRLLREAEETGSEGEIEEAVSMIEKFAGTEDSDDKREAGQNGYTEYQVLEFESAEKYGMKLFEAEAVFDPMCKEKSVGAFMINEKIRSLGQIIRVTPDDNSEEIEKVDRFKVLFSTEEELEGLGDRIGVVGITSEVIISIFTPPKAAEVTVSKVAGQKSELLRIEASRVDNIMDLTGELIIGRSILEQITRDIDAGNFMSDLNERLSELNTYFGKSISGLQRGIMKMRMVRINAIFRKFPRIVRELSASKGKQIKLEFYGQDTELDKGIVDSLGEPLIHIIRNAIDHGIESVDRRRELGKPGTGTLTLNAYHEAAKIVIEISDDGQGIDGEKLKRLAREKGYISEEDCERMSDKEAFDLMFMAGLSSADSVSEISGRGIGMDAVRIAVENMKGTIDIESEKNVGTTFRLRLPLTLAVLKGLLVEVSGRRYAVPIPAVIEVGRIMVDELDSVEGREVLRLRDQTISVVRLDELFELGRSDSKKKFMLILGIGSKRACVLVDDLIGQQELVIKPVDRDYTQTDLLSGASVLGDGSVVFILDAPAIFRKAIAMEKGKIRR